MTVAIPTTSMMSARLDAMHHFCRQVGRQRLIWIMPLATLRTVNSASTSSASARPCRVVRKRGQNLASQPHFSGRQVVFRLKPEPLLRRFPRKNVVFLQDRKRF
jgi:hypothetical protein